MQSIEDIILLHSQRGMNLLREYCPKDFCRRAAQCILDVPRGYVLLTTGFYVAGAGETDGPPGTMFLARALKRLGFSPVIVTDDFCRDFFDSEGIETVYADTAMGESDYADMLDRYAPTLLISIERCGRNIHGDYANMRGVSIADHNARLDALFELGRTRGIPSIGVGDGGNESAWAICSKLSPISCLWFPARSPWTIWSSQQFPTGALSACAPIWRCFPAAMTCSRTMKLPWHTCGTLWRWVPWTA